MSVIISPCQKICKIVDKVCIGCGRTREQIKNWSKYSVPERKEIMNELLLYTIYSNKKDGR